MNTTPPSLTSLPSVKRSGSVQAEFDQLLLALPSNRPLVPVPVAMVILNRNEDGILAMIDDGRLHWAFDLATPGADRRKIHIHRDSIEQAKQSVSRPESVGSLAPLLQRTIPRGAAGGLVTVRALADCFNCSPSHIYNLGLAGVIELISKAKTGPNGSALIDRLSVIAFLTHRRVK